MKLTIPTSTDREKPNYDQRTQLDGSDFLLQFRFNQRLGRWFVDIHDQDDVPIVSGVRLPTNFPIARAITDPRQPKGRLFVLDQAGDPVNETQAARDQRSRDAGLFELGDRFILVYYDEAEREAIVAAIEATE